MNCLRLRNSPSLTAREGVFGERFCTPDVYGHVLPGQQAGAAAAVAALVDT
jgi:hypothetical protein